MLKKLLTTRYFALRFNKIADCVGEKGGVGGVILFYFLGIGIARGTLVFFDYLYEFESKNWYDILSHAVYVFSFVLPVFFLRIFARSFSNKGFYFSMVLPFYFLFLFFCLSLVGEVLGYVDKILICAEQAALIIVLFRKSYTNYRAFQIVGSLLLIIFGMGAYYEVSENLRKAETAADAEFWRASQIFLLACVGIFWVLSRAHILFRDKLLDYLEGREK